MIECLLPYAEYIAYAVVSLFTLGLLVVAPGPKYPISGFVLFLFCLASSLLWPIVLPFWAGTAVRSALEKYIAT